MTPSVLIIGDETDPHVATVRRRLDESGVRTRCLDVWESTCGSSVVITRGQGAVGIDSSFTDLHAVWWRSKPRIQAGLTEGGAFKVRERREFLMGFARVSGAPNQINDPARQETARNKILQLDVAARAGMRVPKTLISAEPAEVARFLDGLGELGIYKPLSWLTSADGKVLYTNILSSPDVLKNQRAIAEAPGIYQEYVEKKCEYRITLLDEQIFCARIYSQERDITKIDWMRDQSGLRYEACACPSPLDEQLRVLMAELGLRFAALDVIEDLEGDHVFLEANPGGNWLWLEERLGLPISAAIAAALQAPHL